MPLPAFDPPGNVNDLDAAARAQWSEFVSARFDEAIAGDPAGTSNDSPRAQYYNAVKTDTAADAQTQEIRGRRSPAGSRSPAFPTCNAGSAPTRRATCRTNTASGASIGMRPARSRK